jgi:DNA-binding HxlR family transcriptional regulator
LINHVKVNISAKDCINKIKKEIKMDVITKMFDGELQMEKMRFERLEEVVSNITPTTWYFVI